MDGNNCVNTDADLDFNVVTDDDNSSGQTTQPDLQDNDAAESSKVENLLTSKQQYTAKYFNGIPDSPDSIRNAFDTVSLCHQAMLIEIKVNGYLQDMTDTKLYDAEDKVLALASSDAVESLFYCTFWRVDVDGEIHNIARIFEYGSIIGFYENALDLKMPDYYPYHVFNKWDVEAKKCHDLSRFKKRRQTTIPNPSRVAYNRILTKNKKNLLESFCNLKVNDPSLTLVKGAIFVLHKNQKFSSVGDQKKIFISVPEEWLELETDLLAYRMNSTSESTLSIGTTFDNVMELSIKDQFKILSSIPNYHKWSWLNENNTQLRFEQKFSDCKGRYPGSPRNRIIHSYKNESESDLIIYHVIKTLAGSACEIPYQVMKEHRMKSNSTRKRKRTTKVKNTKKRIDDTPDDSCDDIADDSIDDIADDSINDVLDPAPDDGTADVPDDNVITTFHSQHKESLYRFYCGELFTRGICAWRILNEVTQKIVLNDYNSETGDFMPYSFVHTSASMVGNVFVYKCTCKIYSTCKSETSTACCHCRLLRDFMIFTGRIQSSDIPDFINKNYVHNAMALHLNPVIELIGKSSNQKFSVTAEGSTNIVSLYVIAETNRKVVECRNTSCKLQKGHKRKLGSLLENTDLCPHLTTFREYFLNHVDQFGDESEAVRTFLPEKKWEKVFNVETGLWCFGKNSPSQQRIPYDKFDSNLRAQVNLRDGSTTDVFLPQIPEETCPCQDGWTSQSFPEGIVEHDTNSILYTDKKCYDIRIFKRLCISHKCKLVWSGEAECIYRSSLRICAGYEIAWDYVESVNNSKVTFSGYVKMMNYRYKLRDPNARFMAVNAFINWWFGWASKLRIDFRQKCGPCNGEINYLACDGTKVGIGFKNAFVEPIETVTQDQPTLKTRLKRMDRCFIVSTEDKTATLFREMRKHLARVSDNILGESLDREEMSPVEFNTLTEQLVESLPRPSRPLFIRMTSESIDPKEQKCAARFFKQLSHDSAVDVVVPFCAAKVMINFIQECRSGKLNTDDVMDFAFRQSYFNTAVTNLLVSSSQCSSNGLPHHDVNETLLYLCYFVMGYHAFDMPADEATPIQSTYNPAKFGRAFYFTDHGEQVRIMRKFTIDEENNKKPAKSGYDDNPSNPCIKNFPHVAQKGMTFVFFWFCPLHGHCYGFHVIPGSEGRKDPSASLYTHAISPPRVLFYDHACSLSEYVKNRESGYFQDTRFYHDIFHGFTHKCSTGFRADTVNGFEGVNTSICEQFNSFIQRIKSSVKLMSQTHFMFYLQFFIHQWNTERLQSYDKRRRVMQLGES